MKIRIPKEVVARVQDAASADILSVVGEFVQLERRKDRHVGLCPFHDDKRPSLDVSPSKGFYYCRSCGAGGTAIGFLMEHLKMSFTDVIRRQARLYQIAIPDPTPESIQETADRDRLLEILSSTTAFYVQSLRSGAGFSALNYLRGDRSLTDDTIVSWRLGYSPENATALYRHLLDKGYEHDFIVRSGVVVERRDGSWADAMRSRLVIPVCDQHGQVVGFGGRALGDESSKYVNTSETEIFLKSELLFGLDRARRAIKVNDRALVVEGYFDVISAHQSGIENVVASMGTAFGRRQAMLLTRLTKNLVTGFDGDNPGTKATNRVIGELKELSYRDQINLRVLTLGEDKDLDQYLRSHTDDESQLFIKTVPWLDWQFQRSLQCKNLADSEVFRSAIAESLGHLRQIQSAATRSHYIRYCAQILSAGDGRYAAQLEQDLRSELGRSRPKVVVPQAKGSREMAEAQLLWIYLHHPDRRAQISQLICSRELTWTSVELRRLWFRIESLELDECDDLLFALSLSPEAKAIVQLSAPEGDLDSAINSAIAALEQARQGDRCRHLLSSWLRSPHPIFVRLLRNQLCPSTD